MDKSDFSGRMNRRDVRARLETLAEPAYRAFTCGLMPGVGNVLGVRLPQLRRLAREIARGDVTAYLNGASEESFEEILLQGMVIGCAKMPVEDRLALIARFIPKISNWSVCDSFCRSLSVARESPEQVFAFVLPYFQSRDAYALRFGIVMLIFYYIDQAHIGRVLSLLEAVRHEDYYVKMAVAWALSMCFAALPEETLPMLRNNTLDDWTYNKALQKILESLQVNAETKVMIRAMKRKSGGKS